MLGQKIVLKVNTPLSPVVGATIEGSGHNLDGIAGTEVDA